MQEFSQIKFSESLYKRNFAWHHSYGMSTSSMMHVLQIPINMCHATNETVGGTERVTSGEKFPIKSRRRG